MKKQLLTLFAVLALSILIISCAPTQNPTNDNTIRTMDVRGSGTVELEPDIAQANIGVQTESPDVSEALNENNTIAQGIIQSMIDLGIEERDIQTQNFNVSPERTSRPGVEDEDIQTFVVRNTVTVVVRDFDMLGEVLATAVAEGANTIRNISFDVEDRAAAVEEARLLAIEDAQSQAQANAEAAGIELVAIHSINVSRNGAPVPRPEIAMERDVAEAVPIAGGTLTIQMTANITYEIE